MKLIFKLGDHISTFAELHALGPRMLHVLMCLRICVSLHVFAGVCVWVGGWVGGCVCSTALRCRFFTEKTLKKSTCAVMIRIIITLGNQIFL